MTSRHPRPPVEVPADERSRSTMPERDLTLAEVAELRRFTPRYLRHLVRRHRLRVLRSGRLIRFDKVALCALEEALRCRSPSPAADPPARSPSPAMSADAAFAAALRATTPSSPRKKPRRSRPSSCAPPGTENVVAFGLSPKR